MMCDCNAPKHWDRKGAMGIFFCTGCKGFTFIPQCCDNEYCKGCEEE
jgi:hypothetical protein